MRLEQHFFTSGEKGFATAASTPGISQNEQFRLESYSLYLLPGALLYEEAQYTPTKYVFYSLDEKRWVVGKAFYAGRDSIGRLGNYFFHNIIISREDLASFQLNPASLIKWLDENGVFKGKILEGPLEVIEKPVEKIEVLESKEFKPQRDLLVSLLQFCFEHESLKKPLLLIGDEEECLDFLKWIYDILPLSLREKLSFDTYSYGVNLNFAIIGIPGGDAFQREVPYSMKLDIASQKYMSNFAVKEPSRQIKLIVKLVDENKLAEFNSMYSVEYYLEKGDYSKFKERYINLSQEVQDWIFDSHHIVIMEQVADKKDLEFLQTIIYKITITEDIAILSREDMLIHYLLEHGSSQSTKLVLDWFCSLEKKQPYYHLLFKYNDLWRMFLKQISSGVYSVNLLLDALKIFLQPEHYSSKFEEVLLDEAINIFRNNKLDKKLAREFMQILDKLPPVESRETDLLRIFLKYNLSGEQRLLEKIIGSNISNLSPGHQEMIMDMVLKDIIRMNNEEKIHHYLIELFDRLSDKYGYIHRLMELLEVPDVPDKIKKTLGEILKEFINSLPPTEKTEEIKARVKELSAEKPSFLSRLKFWQKS